MKLAILVLAAFAVSVIPVKGQHMEQKVTQRTVSVRGEGIVATTPDQVRLMVAVNTQAQNASAAMRAASGRTQEILSLLKKMGVDEKNLQTSRVTVTPTYDYSKQIQPPPIVGYNGVNEFSILFKGKLMEKVGEFMDKAVEAGASNFGGLQYESSKSRELQREALQKAADDAKARAEVLAKQLGATVGAVLTIRESTMGSGPGPVMMRQSFGAESAQAAPVMSGEVSVSAQVEVVFELK